MPKVNEMTDVTTRGRNEKWIIWHGNIHLMPLSQHLPHQLEANTQMISEVEVVQHVNDVVRSIGILLAEFIENANLNERLMVEALLVPNDFDCDIVICFMVQCANNLAETAFANHFQNLVAIANVIMNHLGRKRKKNWINFSELLRWNLADADVAQH